MLLPAWFCRFDNGCHQEKFACIATHTLEALFLVIWLAVAAHGSSYSRILRLGCLCVCPLSAAESGHHFKTRNRY